MSVTDAFFAQGGDIGCLLIHGFSGNPSDLRPLADALADNGYTVNLPVLPGHGSTPEKLVHTEWRTWTEAIAQAHEQMSDMCRHVVLIGFSMGGSLAIIETSRRSPAALVLIGMPTFLGNAWLARMLTVGKYFVRWWYPMANTDFNDSKVRAWMLEQRPGIDIDDARVQAEIRRSGRISTAAIHRFFRVMQHARRLIPKVTCPTLIVHGRQDPIAAPACAEELYCGIRSPTKEITWLDEPGHLLITGPVGSMIVERIVTWIGTQIGLPASAPNYGENTMAIMG